MEAIRETVEVKGHTVTIQLPLSFDAKRVEVIVLALSDSPEIPVAARRTPSPALAGTRIIGDIMSPVVPDAEWDALK